MIFSERVKEISMFEEVTAFRENQEYSYIILTEALIIDTQIFFNAVDGGTKVNSFNTIKAGYETDDAPVKTHDEKPACRGLQ